MTDTSPLVRIVIADDHAILRAGLRALLQVESDMRVVAEASTGEEAIRAINKHSPDVAVMDLSMPEDTSGLAAIRRVAALRLRTRVLVLTMYDEEEYLVPCLNAGARGFLRKTGADRHLVAAIRCVARGGTYLTDRGTAMLVEQHQGGAARVNAVLQHLTAREREVLALTAEGYTAAEIGERLFLSAKTVETYRARTARKLGLTHRTELVRLALRTGLLKAT